jgi:hypothetical protein
MIGTLVDPQGANHCQENIMIYGIEELSQIGIEDEYSATCEFLSDHSDCIVGAASLPVSEYGR